VWWQYIVGVLAAVAIIACFVVLVRFMSQQLTRKTDRRAEDMYDEFSSDRKDKTGIPFNGLLAAAYLFGPTLPAIAKCQP
jgi:hypothetical protein